MDTNTTLSSDLSLSAGESVQWSGRPRQGVVFRRADFVLIPFSVLWTGFAVFWTVGAASVGAPTGFWAFGLVFVAIGSFFIVGRFIVDSMRRAKTSYTVTTHRVVIVEDFFGHKVKSVSLRTLPDITLQAGANGAGTILLGSASSPFGFGSPDWPGLGSRLPPMLELADDARNVFRLLEDARRRTY